MDEHKSARHHSPSSSHIISGYLDRIPLLTPLLLSSHPTSTVWVIRYLHNLTLCPRCTHYFPYLPPLFNYLSVYQPSPWLRKKKARQRKAAPSTVRAGTYRIIPHRICVSIHTYIHTYIPTQVHTCLGVCCLGELGCNTE